MKKFICDDARGTHAEQHARNPRETQTRITCGTCAKRRREEPARTINTTTTTATTTSSTTTTTATTTTSSSSSSSSSRSCSCSCSCCSSCSSSSRGGRRAGRRKNALHCLVMKQKLPRLYGITVWDLQPLLSCCWGYSLGLFKVTRINQGAFGPSLTNMSHSFATLDLFAM